MSGERRTIEQAMAETGTNAPSMALRKLNEGRSRLVYMPHVGAKQKAKALKAAAKAVLA